MTVPIVQGALEMMRSGPVVLEEALRVSARFNADGAEYGTEALREHLSTSTAADPIATIFRQSMAKWDNEAELGWTGGTLRNTADRRELIYAKLALSESFRSLCESKFPFLAAEAPVVIAKAHQAWYTDEIRASRNFYWNAYKRHLEDQNWPEVGVRQLDESTTRIVERLADPTSREAYQAKGLVVGYVQSGKTANFTGVIAKAADAGYKLIVVLAGTLDVLRSQTQRRLDKDMIGRELLGSDYQDDDDLPSFLDHGQKPDHLGSFDWVRLTRPDSDYLCLRTGIEALAFRPKIPSEPLCDPDNLLPVQARIAVVKKNAIVLRRLIDDLRILQRQGLGSPLNQIPALLIDDELDQAGINIKKPKARTSNDANSLQERAATNKAIVDLLKLLPRAQYIGYTATPFANVFVDPSDVDDIFPKDFLISLPRPEGYMGVSDFYDLEGSDGIPGSRPNKEDFVRPVVGQDTDKANLIRAIDSFVLSGAIKVFRSQSASGLSYKHHTMLAHTSAFVADMDDLADMINDLFDRAGYEGGPGVNRLRKLFTEDFARVSQRREPSLPFPKSFDQLAPAVGECLRRIRELALRSSGDASGSEPGVVLILNNENPDQTPDFDRQPIWKILVGGTKLSRGYTVEGLTVSYYRRRAQAADTLMQMGRWFGFRQGYRDLVRLFIGTKEALDKKGRRTIDLYEAFGAICRDEEMFREELTRYASMDEPRITPLQVPPLVPSHMLRPTAKNRMYNAVVTYRNFGGQLSESTLAPSKPEQKRLNHEALTKVLDKADLVASKFEARTQRPAY